MEDELLIDVDLDSINTDPIAPGWHVVTIERVEPTRSQNGDPQLRVTSMVSDPEDPDYDRPIFWKTTFGEKSVVFAKMFLEALGYSGQISGSLRDLAESLVGRVVEVRVRHRQTVDGLRAEVAAWRSAEE